MAMRKPIDAKLVEKLARYGLADHEIADCIGVAESTLRYFDGADPGIRGSLYYDLAAGRRLELETLNGTVVRLGRAHGVLTPASFAVYAALKPYADGAPAEPTAR